MPTQNTTTVSSDPSAAYHQNQSFPAPAHQNPMLPPHLAGHDPGSNQRHPVAGLLPAPYALHPSPVFQSAVPRSEPQPLCSVSPLMMPPAGSESRVAPAGPAAPPAAPAAYMGQEILSTLKPAVPPASSDIHKPILAPNFLPAALFPPHKFQEPMGKPILQHSKEMDVFSQPPNVIKPMSVSKAECCRSCFSSTCVCFWLLLTSSPPPVARLSTGCPHESWSGCSQARGLCASLAKRLPAVRQ